VAIPNVLALDFDGVLCDGLREYFETSRRTYERIWPGEAAPTEEAFTAFRELRPVIMSGWEMPVLLRAIVAGRPASAVLRGWETLRDELVDAASPDGRALVSRLRHTLDLVRREWIAAARSDWLAHNAPYCPRNELRRAIADPEQTFVVTTKEGEFARAILEDWKVPVAGIQGKEAGVHKCDNLRALIADYTAARGRRPALWFVEDRLETLRHVTTHADLDDVGLFLAAWGYNTPETRAAAQDDGRVRLLQLEQFRRGPSAWA
jgi:hypothetical protein